MKSEAGALAHVMIDGERVTVSAGQGGARVTLSLGVGSAAAHSGRVMGAVAVNSTGTDLLIMGEVEASTFVVDHGGDIGAAEAALLRMLDPEVASKVVHIPRWATYEKVQEAVREEMRHRAEGGLVDWRGSVADLIVQVLGRSPKGTGQGVIKSVMKAVRDMPGVATMKDKNRTDYIIIRTPLAAGLVGTSDAGAEGFGGD